MITDVSIERHILHILDNSIGMPIISEKEHPFNDDIYEFLKNHIEKVFKDINIKKAFFEDGENIVRDLCSSISQDNSNFLECTKRLAEIMYGIMIENVSIPSCDLICSLFNGDDKKYLGMFILNYKTSYIHYVEELDNKKVNTVIKQRTTLPNINQRIEEFVIIDLEDNSILLKEKKYEINGEKEYYLSKYFLKSKDLLSDKEKVDIINKTSKMMVADYYDGDVKKMAEIKTAIVESIEETDSIDIEHIKNKAFNNNLELQEMYSDELYSRGLTEKAIELNENVIKKIPRTQKLVTDDGIELKIPISYLTSQDKVEFINNTDGTISILLKNIRDIQDK